jgi:gluconate 5-dehydrogenase
MSETGGAGKFSLAGRIALVTGASRGLGRAIARAFVEAGADLVVVSRGKQALEEAAADFRSTGKRAWAFDYDLGEVDGIPDLFARITAETGLIQILANVAGVNIRGQAVDFPLKEWRRVLELNVTAPFVLSQCFARELIRRGEPGKIINIASLLTEAARPTIPAYTASKGAIRQLTKALAVEWAKHRINVNAVGPGYFSTELTRPLWEDPQFDRWVLDRTPMRRWGQPGDLTGAAVFLASPASDFVTGHILYVDGGWLANL